jgi:hypothetical protein
MAALVTLLSNCGILSDPGSVEDAADVRTVSADRTEHLAGEYTPPDPPPPRA